MGRTNAERQRAYRARRRDANAGSGDQRLTTWLRTEASQALKRLAAHYGCSQRAMLERLIVEADERELAALELDSEAWDRYWKGSRGR